MPGPYLLHHGLLIHRLPTSKGCDREFGPYILELEPLTFCRPTVDQRTNNCVWPTNGVTTAINWQARVNVRPLQQQRSIKTPDQLQQQAAGAALYDPVKWTIVVYGAHTHTHTHTMYGILSKEGGRHTWNINKLGQWGNTRHVQCSASTVSALDIRHSACTRLACRYTGQETIDGFHYVWSFGQLECRFRADW